MEESHQIKHLIFQFLIKCNLFLDYFSLFNQRDPKLCLSTILFCRKCSGSAWSAQTTLDIRFSMACPHCLKAILGNDSVSQLCHTVTFLDTNNDTLFRKLISLFEKNLKTNNK